MTEMSLAKAEEVTKVQSQQLFTSNSVLRAGEIVEVLCHRFRHKQEQYLVRWKEAKDSKAADAICSWHSLDELTSVLHLVQKYVETCNNSSRAANRSAALPLHQTSRKRKSPGAEPVSRDSYLGNGLLTPSTSSNYGRSSSTSSYTSETTEYDVEIYNGVLEKREGFTVAKKSKHSSGVKVDATSLPTKQMLHEAAETPVTQAGREIREAFYRKVRRIPNLSLENKIDSSTPSLDFKFVENYVLGKDVYRADRETAEGCDRPCKPNMGQHCGCELPRQCACLEFAAVNERILESDEPDRYREYMKQKEAGDIDRTDLPKRFPYSKPKREEMPQTLVEFYRSSRHAIYECNVNCKCGPVCKSRVVQTGRKIPLTIFKTADRGWGLYSRKDIIKGEFIDTYLGEVITNKEADRREAESTTKHKASYLYSLDKFVNEIDLTSDNCYVVDGQYMGGPTRFINHSCEPNCRQFTVSYNKYDFRIYDLAFFAIEDIPKGTELTFDYIDPNEEEEEEAIRRREEAAKDPDNVDKVLCNCGARKCRGYLWV